MVTWRGVMTRRPLGSTRLVPSTHLSPPSGTHCVVLHARRMLRAASMRTLAFGLAMRRGGAFVVPSTSTPIRRSDAPPMSQGTLSVPQRGPTLMRTFARTAKQEPEEGEHSQQSASALHATKQSHSGEAVATKEKRSSTVHELVFEPFEEVRAPLSEVHKQQKTNGSMARMAWFAKEAEDAINAQIQVEQTISHVYESMHAYFDRDNVALRGLAAYFLQESLEERKHANKLIAYLNRRGGRVHLATVPEPVREFDHAEKGDALNAMELALALERLNMQKLQELDRLANELGDYNLSDYIDDMLDDQSKDVKQVADYVAQLMRVGKGHGVWHWDAQLYEEVK